MMVKKEEYIKDLWDDIMNKSDCRYFNQDDGNCDHFTYPGEYDPCTDGDFKHCCECYPHFFGDKIVPYRFKQVGNCFIDTQNTKKSYCCANEIDCKNIVDEMNDFNGWGIGMQRRGNRFARQLSAIKREFRERGILTGAEFLELIDYE